MRVQYGLATEMRSIAAALSSSRLIMQSTTTSTCQRVRHPSHSPAVHRARTAVHHYEHHQDCTLPGKVPIARMMSEFGWQSDAPYYSIKSVTDPQDWSVW